jgi:hypothetical protein
VEDPAQLGRVNQDERELNNPDDQEADEVDGRGTLGNRDAVLDSSVRGPDGFNRVRGVLTGREGVDRQPERSNGTTGLELRWSAQKHQETQVRQSPGSAMCRPCG